MELYLFRPKIVDVSIVKLVSLRSQVSVAGRNQRGVNRNVSLCGIEHRKQVTHPAIYRSILRSGDVDAGRIFEGDGTVAIVITDHVISDQLKAGTVVVTLE